MVGKYAAYPEYKPSGVEWLGDIPFQWETLAVRRCLESHRQGYYSQSEYQDTGVLLLRISDLGSFGETDFSGCPRVKELEEIEPFYLEEFDFVFARTGGAGTFCLVENLPEPAVYASYLIRFRFTLANNPRYLRYVFLSPYFQEGIKKNIHGGVNQNIHAEDIKQQCMALPPIPEQTQIAAFLDHETAQIDALIAKQQHLIALLEEKRQAVISHAVTKGLNPDAPLRPSGIDWLGDVPEHWQVVKLSHRYEVLLGKMLDQAKVSGNYLGH